MRKFLKYFSAAILIVALYASWGLILAHKEETRNFVQKTLHINQPCSKPLEFSVGRVDAAFGITDLELADLSKQAANFWNAAAGKEVFRYSQSSNFKINLIFDQRQEGTLEAREMESNLENLEGSYNEISEKYESLNSNYKKQVDAYEKHLEDYKKDLEKYNDKVDYWNDKGGAPEDEYEKLKDWQDDLEDEFKKLEKERKAINELVKKSNNLANQENKIANVYNENLETYKNQFGDTREFEKGLFNGEAINIYQFEEKSDLELTLIHELGHYLGLDHVQNSQSIMYYLIGDQNLEKPELTGEDMSELETVCQLS